MCVICFKPKGKELPSREVLMACFRANSDGVGFVTPSRFYKTMDFDDFYNNVLYVSKKEPCIIHFRYATHGSVCRNNCHPFKGEIEGMKPFYFAHNGILNIKPIDDMTDSETAFVTKFIPAIKAYGFDSMAFDDVIDKYRGGSRFAFMHGDKVRLYGDYKQYDGCYFSNLNFVHYIARARTHYNSYLSWY